MKTLARFITEKPLVVTLIVTAITMTLVFYSFFPSKLPTLTSKSDTDQTQNNQVNPAAPKGVHTINARSDMKNYQATIIDQASLLTYLDTIGIWDKTYNQNVQKNTFPLANIVVILTGEEQSDIVHHQGNGKDVLFSSGVSFSGNVLTIYVNLPPSILDKAYNSNVLDNAVINTAFIIKNPDEPKNPEKKAQLTSLLKEISSKNLQFFQISPINGGIPVSTTLKK